MAAVVLDRVSKVYAGGVLAVDDLRLEVAEGELLVLLGPSGCGKTTILRIIAGLEAMTSGRLWLDGALANDLPTRFRNVAMVFQHGALYSHRTVRQNLAFPLKIARMQDKQAIDARVVEIARGLGIEDLLDRMPRALSGGERQRVAIGRALIRGEPAVLLMDEPLASLDSSLRLGLRAEIESLVRSFHLTTVYVTHDQVEALTLADRIAVIRKGKLEDIGSPAKIYADPGTAFVAAFLGSPPINMVSATIWVEIGDRIVIDLGPQTLYLPWSDPRSDSLTPYHGQPVMVGIRPDALTPVGDAGGDCVIHGRVHSLEYHGHEWLARLEAGLTLVDISTGADAGQNHNRSGGHRRASLLLRLDAPRDWVVGREVNVAIDVPKIFFFAADGRRIDQSPHARRFLASEAAPWSR
jgi:multiple sugar transport system ATP-binding protein